MPIYVRFNNNNNNNVYFYSAIPTGVLIALHRTVQKIDYNDRCLHVRGKYDKRTNRLTYLYRPTVLILAFSSKLEGGKCISNSRFLCNQGH